jgi:hypothetical protein
MSAPVTRAEYEALLKRVGALGGIRTCTRGRPNLVPLAREAAMMAMRVEAAALRRDITEAQILIVRLQRRYLNDNKRNGHHRLRTAIGGGSSPCGSGAGWAAAVDGRGGCAAG